MPEIPVAAPAPRKEQPSVQLTREQFEARMRERYVDAKFDEDPRSLDAVIAAAWDGYVNYRKAPHTREAGPEFQDPSYQLSTAWIATRENIRQAEKRHRDTSRPTRMLVISGSMRSSQTCPGESPKSYRMAKLAESVLTGLGHTEVDFLDLSLLTAEFGRNIYPCKSCVSTAMPLCHWPCSCYPNHAMGQANDWMAELYPRFVDAHGILIITPVNWYQVPSGLKSLMDRLVCADGGNADPTRTQGKDALLAKTIELAGWDFPKHLGGRTFGTVVHGDAAGTENVRRALTDWAGDMHLIPVEGAAIDRMIGYYEPYALNHVALDDDPDLLAEVKNVAIALHRRTVEARHGQFKSADDGLKDPRPK